MKRISVIVVALFLYPLLQNADAGNPIANTADSSVNMLLLSDSAPVPCPPPGGIPITWKPGESIGGIRLGYSYADVKCIMGTPSEIRRTYNDSDGTYTMWTDYDGVRLTFSYPDSNNDGLVNDYEQVDGIHADPLSAPSLGWYPQPWNYLGVQFLSSTYTDAVAVLGLPQASYGNSHWWYSKGVHLYFHSTQGYLFSMYVFEPF